MIPFINLEAAANPYRKCKMEAFICYGCNIGYTSGPLLAIVNSIMGCCVCTISQITIFPPIGCWKFCEAMLMPQLKILWRQDLGRVTEVMIPAPSSSKSLKPFTCDYLLASLPPTTLAQSVIYAPRMLRGCTFSRPGLPVASGRAEYHSGIISRLAHLTLFCNVHPS